MNVFHFSAECDPFVKAGGLSDVVGTLPRTFTEMGHNAVAVIPHHGRIDDNEHEIRTCDSFTMLWNGDQTRVSVACTEKYGFPVYFLRAYPYFQPNEKFIYHDDTGIDVGRYLFFCMAGLVWLRRHCEQEGIQPHVLHAHDWHTGTLPFLLRRVFGEDPTLRQAASVHSIHNIKYQGHGIGWHLQRAGLPPVDNPLLHSMGLNDNCMAIGLAYATVISTVSPRYADELLYEGMDYGLAGLLHTRQTQFVGILNGIDTNEWNPAESKALSQAYATATLEQRAKNKAALQEELGLPVRPDVPLLGMVTRLTDQKGIDIALPALGDLLNIQDVQFVLLGTGAYHLETGFWQMGQYFPDKASINLYFDVALSERIYAGIDMFVMPSQFEPCGIGQMLAMRYGAIPVVREVGGLVNTVHPSVGFLFRDYHPGALDHALNRALNIYRNNKAVWQARQKRAMQTDLSWGRSADEYINLYQRAIDVHRLYAV